MRLFTPYTPPAFLVDFLLNCAVTLFATTVYSSTPWVLNLLLLLPAVILYVLEKPAPAKRDVPRALKKNDDAKEEKLDALPVKPFITNYRGAMMVITCVAILAVDFRVFPRRFAKVENWGTSLMDMGVGSFVFTAGVVSVRSSLKESTGRRPPLSKRAHVHQTLDTAPCTGYNTSHLCQGSGLRRACHRIRHPLELLLHTGLSATLCRSLSGCL
jgi:phosphatidylinositol glycan class W